MRDVVIVGASLAGITAADALRTEGYDGAITLIGEEHHGPYSRPPLSKAVLSGAAPADSVLLPAPADDVVLRLGQRAAGLDPARRLVRLDNGESVPYDGLVIATGGRARSLAAPGQRGEHRLRTLDDASELHERLMAGPSVLVLGGGFLGMEIASTCRSLGLAVTVVDREPPLERLLGGFLAGMLTEAARDAGVQIAVSPGDAELLGAPDIHGVRLGDGRALTADLVVAAVGDVPNTEWLASSELLAGPGPLRVDGCCRLRPDIVAAGDVAALPDGAGAHARTPYWSSAVDQGRLAAAALLHGDAAVPAATNPYFWTDQFGIELKICGRLPVHGAPLVIDGAVSERRAVLQWVAGGHPLAAATINHRMPVGRLKRLAVPLAPAA